MTLTSEELQSHLDEQAADQVDTTQEVVETPVVETPQKGFRELFAEKGFAVEDLDEASLAEQVAQQLSGRQELERELAELRQAKQELERIAYEAKKASPEPEPKEAAKELRRWSKIELDPELKTVAEYDAESGLWRGKEKFGALAYEAASKLNEANREQQRRARLLVEDPLAAWEEAGLLDIVEDKFTKRLSEVQEQFSKKVMEDQQKAFESQKLASRNQDADRFFEENKSKLFQVGVDGQPKKGLDGQFVLTDFGKKARDLTAQLRADGVADEAIALRRAVEICNMSFAAPPAPPKAEEKKAAFLDKTRTVATEASAPAPIRSKLDTVTTPGRKKFLELALSDPDNAEALGDLYRG